MVRNSAYARSFSVGFSALNLASSSGVAAGRSRNRVSCTLASPSSRRHATVPFSTSNRVSSSATSRYLWDVRFCRCEILSVGREDMFLLVGREDMDRDP